MKFDKLIKMYEKHRAYFPEGIKEILEQTNLFVLDSAPHELLGKSCTPEDIDNFFLPFPSMAIEDKAGVIFLIDTIPNQIGTNHTRLFIDIIFADTPLENFRPDEYEEARKKRAHIKPGECTIVFGRIDKFKINEDKSKIYEGRTPLDIIGTVDLVIWCTPKKVLGIMGQKEISMMKQAEFTKLKSAIGNAAIGMEEVMLINTPKNFILEEKGPKVPNSKNKPKKRILKSWERPIYTILNPKNIRKKMGLSNPSSEAGSGRLRSPHERRRHDRWYRDEKYSKDEFGDPRKEKISPDGKPYYLHRVIPTTWIGPSSATVKNKRYKVRLDL